MGNKSLFASGPNKTTENADRAGWRQNLLHEFGILASSQTFSKTNTIPMIFTIWCPLHSDNVAFLLKSFGNFNTKSLKSCSVIYREVKKNKMDALTSDLYSDVDVQMAHGSQMFNIRPLRTSHWHLRICLTVASRLIRQHIRNRCQVSVAKRRQLASRRRLLQIAC
jgi:hypothetical protein